MNTDGQARLRNPEFPIEIVGSVRPLSSAGDRPRVGLALGAGAVRGFAHIGVLCVLAEAGIPVDLIVGTSVGAFTGAMWAYDPDFDRLRETFESFLHSPRARRSIFAFPSRSTAPDDEGAGFFRRLAGTLRDRYTFGKAVIGRSIVPRAYMEAAVDGLVPDRDLTDTLVPFACTAVDLKTAELVVFTAGPARRAILASSSIPGVLPPVEWGTRLLVDGAAMGGLPVDVCRILGADFVIASDVRSAIRRPVPLENGLDVVVRADTISAYYLTQVQAERADFSIRPDVGHLHWADFNRYRDAFDAGFEAARKAVPILRERLAASAERRRRFRGWWPRLGRWNRRSVGMGRRGTRG